MGNRFATFWALFICGAYFAFFLAPEARAGALGADVNADVDAFGHSQMDSGSLLAFSQKTRFMPCRYSTRRQAIMPATGTTWLSSINPPR